MALGGRLIWDKHLARYLQLLESNEVKPVTHFYPFDFSTLICDR